MRKTLLLLCFGLVLAWTQGYAQERTVSGKVTDPNTGQGIPGVSVFIKGTAVGTVTDGDGKYSIATPTGTILVFQAVGLEKQEIAVGSEATIDVSLKEDVQNLGEVVVTAGAIEKQKKELGYTISTIGGEELLNARETNLVNALSGKITGLQITNQSGNLGSSSRILIRGGSSLTGNNQPLFVVDGVPISNSNFSGNSDGGRITGTVDNGK